jgi:Flp pilus assembly protein TadD
MTARHLIATLSCISALLSQVGCNSKPSAAAPVTKSEISIDDYNKTCRTDSNGGCEDRQVIWRAFFKSFDGKLLTLHNKLGDISMSANPGNQISPGAIIGFRGRLADSSSSSSDPIELKDASLDFVETEAQTKERLREITNLQTNFCLSRDMNSESHRNAEQHFIEFTYSEATITRDPWTPEQTQIQYAESYGVPGEPAVVHALLTCQYKQGSYAVDLFTPAQNNIYGKHGLDNSSVDLGTIGFTHDYLVDDDVPLHPTPTAPSKSTTLSRGASDTPDGHTTVPAASDAVATANGPTLSAAANAAAEAAAFATQAAKDAEVSAPAAIDKTPQPNDQASASAFSSSAAVSSDASNSVNCTTSVDCVKSMLALAKAENLAGAMDAARQLDSLPKPARGDRASARKLNQSGLAALNSGGSDNAVDLFVQGMQTDPGDEEIISNLAYAYAAVGQLAKSEDTAVLALSINPRRTSIWAPLAATLAKENRQDQAVEAMWLAYQFSGDKQKTLNFIESKLNAEKDSDALKMYVASKAWFEQNVKPSILQ